MIVEKHKKQEEEEEEVVDSPTTETTQTTYELQEEVETNPMIEAYKTVRAILETIKEDENDDTSPRLFKTIKMDNGQLARIKGSKLNEEYGIAFPAVFIHFIDIYYNQGAYKIAEGKGTMRIHYVLNRLNNSDDGEEGELEGLKVYKRIIAAIEDNKANFPSLINRFQLQYWDQPLSFDDGLQPYWIDYQIWFNDYTSYTLKNYVDVYAPIPPFTHHSDQNEIANPDNLPNDSEPKFEDVVGFEP